MRIAMPVLRTLGLLVLLSAAVASARADDAAPETPAAVAPAGQKGGPAARSGSVPSSTASAEQHKLPPDSVTKQALDLPGRKLAFTATDRYCRVAARLRMRLALR